MIPLPKINGVFGNALRVVGAIITGPSKIDGMKADVAELKTDVKILSGDVREIKGYLAGRRDTER